VEMLRVRSVSMALSLKGNQISQSEASNSWLSLPHCRVGLTQPVMEDVHPMQAAQKITQSLGVSMDALTESYTHFPAPCDIPRLRDRNETRSPPRTSSLLTRYFSTSSAQCATSVGGHTTREGSGFGPVPA
jgi:hypothetical protein